MGINQIKTGRRTKVKKDKSEGHWSDKMRRTVGKRQMKVNGGD